jgi:hypothetical protein
MERRRRLYAHLGFGRSTAGEERSDGADHVGEHCGRLAAPRKEHGFELDLEWALGKVVDVCVVLTGGAKGVVIYCGGVTNGNATTAELVVHELGDVVDVTPQ